MHLTCKPGFFSLRYASKQYKKIFVNPKMKFHLKPFSKITDDIICMKTIKNVFCIVRQNFHVFIFCSILSYFLHPTLKGRSELGGVLRRKDPSKAKVS
jgi:hypothetical protein